MPNAIIEPNKDQLTEWHFAAYGLDDDRFRNGVYHGVVKIPDNYPMSPPSIKMITPNGRYMPNMDICLEVTNYHPETWNPVVKIR